MGWWKIRSVESGQIDWDSGRHGLANARPASDTPENYYGGDGPADEMGRALSECLALVGESWPDGPQKSSSVTKHELHQIFFDGVVPARWQAHGNAMLAIVQGTWGAIDRQYKLDWKRPAYDEERQAVFNFVVNPYFE